MNRLACVLCRSVRSFADVFACPEITKSDAIAHFCAHSETLPPESVCYRRRLIGVFEG